MGEIEEVWFGGMSQFLSNLLHELSPCMLSSGQWTLVAPQAHRGSFVPEIFTLKEFLCSS